VPKMLLFMAVVEALYFIKVVIVVVTSVTVTVIMVGYSLFT
jgi:hypothetical protein